MWTKLCKQKQKYCISPCLCQIPQKLFKRGARADVGPTQHCAAVGGPHAPLSPVLLTVHRLGVVSLGVVEPIRPLVYLHPKAWASSRSARRRPARSGWWQRADSSARKFGEPPPPPPPLLLPLSSVGLPQRSRPPPMPRQTGHSQQWLSGFTPPRMLRSGSERRAEFVRLSSSVFMNQRTVPAAFF